MYQFQLTGKLKTTDNNFISYRSWFVIRLVFFNFKFLNFFFCFFCFIIEPSPPLFTHPQPREVDFLKSSKAKLSCNASGVPLPSITWFKDGNSLSSSSVIGSKSYSILNFESVHPHDQGRYWCEANSTEGQSRSAPVNLTGIETFHFFERP